MEQPSETGRVWIATGESSEYSTDSGQMALNVILTKVYGQVESKAPSRQVDTIVSPDFVAGLAAEQAARATLPSERGTPRNATPSLTVTTKVAVHQAPLMKTPLTAQVSAPPARTAEKPAVTVDAPSVLLIDSCAFQAGDYAD